MLVNLNTLQPVGLMNLQQQLQNVQAGQTVHFANAYQMAQSRPQWFAPPQQVQQKPLTQNQMHHQYQQYEQMLQQYQQMHQQQQQNLMNQPSMKWGDAHKTWKMDADGAKDFIGGLVKGLVQKDHFDEISHCLQRGEVLAGELTEAIGDYEKKDYIDKLKAMEVMGTIISGLPQDLSTCEKMKGDIDRIERWAQIFRNPGELFKMIETNGIKNLAAIGTDITHVAQDLEKKDNKLAGFDVADLLILNLGPVPQIHQQMKQNKIVNLENLVFTSWNQ